jgi:hypothetical protein
MRESTKEELANLLAAARHLQNEVENDTREVLTRADTLEMVQHFVDLRDINEDIKIVRKSLELIEDRLSHSEIPDQFKRTRTTTTTFEGIGRVSIGHKWGCSIIDKAVGFNWLRENGHGGLIIETVNASTLAAFAKNLQETEGKALPQDKFKTSINPYTSITKAD